MSTRGVSPTPRTASAGDGDRHSAPDWTCLRCCWLPFYGPYYGSSVVYAARLRA